MFIKHILRIPLQVLRLHEQIDETYVVLVLGTKVENRQEQVRKIDG